MATRRLVITGNEQGQFFLLVEGDTLTVGGSRLGPATVLQHVKVAHIHCVLDVEGEAVTCRNDEPGHPGTPREVKAGEILEGGGARLVLEGAHVTPPLDDVGLLPVDAAAAPAPAAPAGPDEGPVLGKRLIVIDGADKGQILPLPEHGSVTVGKDRKHADLVLHDLYVARIHCVLHVDGDKMEVADEGDHGLQVNGQKVQRSKIGVGDVFRIGNSHIRIETVVAGPEVAKVAGGAFAAPEPIELVVEEEGASPEDYEVVEADDGDGLSEPARLLKVWRDKLAQLSGQTFGRYGLGALLGRGRCGVVFRADDQKTGQLVALKVFSPQFPKGEKELQRFAHAMKGLLPLRHANIVTLLSAGKTGAYSWVAREYVEGESVAEIVERLAETRKFSEKRACRVAVGVARALDFARKHRLRHGHVTPANILIRSEDKAVKLADLMLGSVLEGSQLAKAALELRAPAEVAYLSPEQAEDGAYVDELSDLYGLGAVLYALLSGRPPFVGETAEEVLEQLRGHAKVPRLSTINEDVPDALERVVMKLLARRQENRYQTPAELLDEMEPIAEELGIEV